MKAAQTTPAIRVAAGSATMAAAMLAIRAAPKAPMVIIQRNFDSGRLFIWAILKSAIKGTGLQLRSEE